MDFVAVPGGREERGSHFLSFALDLSRKALFPIWRSEQEMNDYFIYGTSRPVAVVQKGCPLQLSMTKAAQRPKVKSWGKSGYSIINFCSKKQGRGDAN